MLDVHAAVGHQHEHRGKHEPGNRENRQAIEQRSGTLVTTDQAQQALRVDRHHRANQDRHQREHGPVHHDAAEPAAVLVDSPDAVERHLDTGQQQERGDDQGHQAGQRQFFDAEQEGIQVGSDLLAGGRQEIFQDECLQLIGPLVEYRERRGDTEHHRQQRDQREQAGVGQRSRLGHRTVFLEVRPHVPQQAFRPGILFSGLELSRG